MAVSHWGWESDNKWWLSTWDCVPPLTSLALDVQKAPGELLVPILKWQPGNAGSGMSEGTRNSIRTIKLWGRPKQEGRQPSFYHTLDCKWKVLSALGVDLPMSIKATSTVLQPRPPAQMIPISDKLASKQTMISASTSVHSCYHGQALQLLFYREDVRARSHLWKPYQVLKCASILIIPIWASRTGYCSSVTQSKEFCYRLPNKPRQSGWTHNLSCSEGTKFVSLNSIGFMPIRHG